VGQGFTVKARAMPLDDFSPPTLTETTFHRRFAQPVAIVKAGKPLPASPPEEKVK